MHNLPKMGYSGVVTLKEWIEGQQLSERQVARRARVPTSSLSRFLLGQSSLSAENMQRIVSFTGGAVTLDSLIAQGSKVLRKKQRVRAARDEAEAST